MKSSFTPLQELVSFIPNGPKSSPNIIAVYAEIPSFGRKLFYDLL